MTISAGSRLGPYEILAPLGAGGMGEVYKARDTRLERTVAVKVLPSHLSSSAEVRQRFEREAKTISQLSHPHICALYDVGNQDGTEYLVMEFLEGESLADRLLKGPLPPDQVLRCGIEIADALDRAHRQGVIHRDLKPGNVMLTKSGAKVLDFGLAKLKGTKGTPGVPGLSALPTATERPLTAEGAIVGTLQYMAPEQLEGKEADARTDIFALGTVTYEMATGQKAFAGKSQASLIAAILEHDPPPISTLQPLTPPALDHVVKTCLAKDSDARPHAAHDVMLELKWIAEGSSQAGVPVIPPRRARERLAWTLMTLVAITALALAVVQFREAPSETQPIRFSVFPPDRASFERPPSISPDGARLALVVSTAGSRTSLWIRRLDSL